MIKGEVGIRVSDDIYHGRTGAYVIELRGIPHDFTGFETSARQSPPRLRDASTITVSVAI